MYKITKDGKVLAVASKLTRCKMQANGFPAIAGDDDKSAVGIVVNGTIYNLPGFETAAVQEFGDDRTLLGEVIAGSATTEDVYMALAELGQLVAGGANHG